MAGWIPNIPGRFYPSSTGTQNGKNGQIAFVLIVAFSGNSFHSSPESGPNPKVNNHPESIWNMVWLFMPVEKNLFRKFFIGGPSRKF